MATKVSRLRLLFCWCDCEPNVQEEAKALCDELLTYFETPDAGAEELRLCPFCDLWTTADNPICHNCLKGGN